MTKCQNIHFRWNVLGILMKLHQIYCNYTTSETNDLQFTTYSNKVYTGGSRRSHWQGPAASSAKNTEHISELGGSGGMPP